MQPHEIRHTNAKYGEVTICLDTGVYVSLDPTTTNSVVVWYLVDDVLLVLKLKRAGLSSFETGNWLDNSKPRDESPRSCASYSIESIN